MPFRPTSRSLQGVCRALLCGVAALVAVQHVSADEGSSTAKKSYAVGDTVSVREGDTWSKAKVLQHEGRRYQIRYDDGTEEWVGTDQLRASGHDTEPTVPDTKSPKSKESKQGADDSDSAQPPKRTAPRKFKAGDEVEIRFGAFWRAGTIKKVKSNRYFVHYDGMPSQMDQWVFATEVRKRGEQGDDDRFPSPRGKFPFPQAGGRLNGDPFHQKEPDDPDRPLTPAKTDAANNVQFTTSPAAGKSDAKFTPDAGSPTKLAPRSIVLKGGQSSRFARVSEVAFGRDMAIVTFSGAGTRHQSSLVERVDLSRGKSTGVWPQIPDSKLAAIAPDGQRAVIQSDRLFPNTKGRLDVFSLAKQPPGFVVGFIPYQELSPKTKDVRWTSLIDDSHLLTIGAGFPEAQFVCWDLKDCRAQWIAALPLGSDAGLSASGKQVAFALDKQVVVIDALSGNTLAAIPNPCGRGSISFSPDGGKLAIATTGVLGLFDLLKGELIASIASESLLTRPSWTDNEHVLAGDSLFSVSKKCPVWTYKRPNAAIPLEVAGGVTWFIDGSGPRLVGLSLPDTAAQKAEQLVDDNSFFLVRPGGKLSLDVQAGADSEKVAEYFKQQLEAAGVTVEPNQPAVLRATAAKGRTREVAYNVHHFGQPFQKETVKKSVTENVYTVTIAGADKKPAWQVNSNSGPPMFVRADAGESIDDALRRQSQASSAWFLSLKLPTHIPTAANNKGLGESPIGSDGVADSRGNSGRRSPVPSPSPSHAGF